MTKKKFELLYQNFLIWKMPSPKTQNDDLIVKYNKQNIIPEDIKYFQIQTRKKNDKSNKIRESIIGAVLNDKIPIMFYENEEWINLRDNLLKYIQNLVPKEKIINIQCEHCGGRKYHHDFQITLNKKYVFKVEFKFNATQIGDTPQYVSPMKPSQYLTGNYEEYFYDSYLSQICELAQVPLVDKTEYLKGIHNSSPPCVNELQKKYYQGCKQSSKFTGKEEDILFYKKVKDYAKDSIEKFILQKNIKMDKLSEYLLNTQKNKVYMLYHKGEFHQETVNLENYEIVSVSTNKRKNGYVADTKSGKKIKILLRWKNGNGIAFPAFQIS